MPLLPVPAQAVAGAAEVVVAMAVADTMAAWGIVRPTEVVELAAATGLLLQAACSLLEQESGGGRNVWGHDAVDTGGIYTKGSPVTRTVYQNYKPLADAGKIGRQGCGPCQLTAKGYQDRADALGGCWDWRTNVRVGFQALADLIARYGLPDGIRRYNGSGPAAEAYRDRMIARIAAWTDRLGPLTPEDDLQPDERQALFKIAAALDASGIGKGRLPGRSPTFKDTVDDAFGWTLTAAGRADVAANDIAALRAEVAQLRDQIGHITGGGDPTSLAQAVAAALIARLKD